MGENEETSPNREINEKGLFRNLISFVGIAIVAAALTSIILLFLIELTADERNPYSVLVTYILLPAVLAFGLVLVFFGAWLERRRRRRSPGTKMKDYPVLDLNDPRRRRQFVLSLCLGLVFLFMTAFGSYRAYEYTESVEFCGQQCHDVMKPEFVAYNASPHARVRCVECHVGSGAEWYVRSKWNGMHQLYAVTFKTYDKPIQTPIHNLRPADETCAKCHWPEKFHGEQLKVFNHYGYDENNTLNQTRLLLKTGGGSPNTGEVGGIHWHMNVANEITYLPIDEKRQDIPWVRLKDRNGNVTEYLARGSQLTPEQIEQGNKRKMDCIDCHNRPTHIYLSPNEAVDKSLAAGRLDATLPYLKAKGVEALAQPYQTNEEAVAAIETRIHDYYRTAYPDLYATKTASITSAVAELQQIYQTYFFPEMKTDWKAHINNIGHYNATGCFRCHDGQHVSPQGKVIRNDCAICHTAVDQTVRGSTFVPPGNIFKHPVDLGDKNTWQCAACHKGDSTFKHPLNLGDISQFQCSECHTGKTYKMPS